VDRTRIIVQELTQRFPSRNGLNPPALHGAAEFLESELRSLGLDVHSASYFDGVLDVRNLIVHQEGRDPSSPLIVVGAHYDTVLETPGADDNASGAAGVIELARRFRDIPTEHTLSFVLFPHEEPPFFFTAAMGSRHYAAELARTKTRVRFMVALEMIGYASSEVPQRYPFPLMRLLGRYPREGDFISIVGNLRSRHLVRRLRKAMRKGCSLRVESLSAPGFLSPLYLSDHSSFWKFNFPAMMITDTAFMRNPHYHMPTDTFETINFNFLGQVLDGVEAGLRSFDPER
jgi:Zn-dependent M28 family amino/carboxypeptidase